MCKCLCVYVCTYLRINARPTLRQSRLKSHIKRAGKDPPKLWGNAANTSICLIYLALLYMQSIAILSGFQLQFPKAVNEILDAWTFTSDITSTINHACASWTSDFLSGFIFKLTGPLLVAVMFILIYAVSNVLARFMSSLQMDGDVLMNCYGSLFFTFFVAIVAQTVSLFQCYGHPNGESSMRSAPATLCGSDDWNSGVAVAVFACLVLICGSMGLFARAIWHAPANFAQERFRKRWKFLFIKFRPNMFWFSMAVLIKGVLLNLSSMVATSGLPQAFTCARFNRLLGMTSVA